MKDDRSIDWENMEWDEEAGEFVSTKPDEDTSDEDDIETKDALGNKLETGDTVFLTKDLDVKGSALKIKQGTKIKKIKVIDDPNLIECKVGKSTIFLKTIFLKKV